ncbi:MAG: SSI family serine proteinase inhibitor [Egibacteraceae bacterium]
MESQSFFTMSIASVNSGEIIAEVSLTCEPPGGSHPNPTAACEQLSRADGRIEDIPAESGFCTFELNPVIVSASGSWRGEARRFEKEFANRCLAVRGTGGVLFAFGNAGLVMSAS